MRPSLLSLVPLAAAAWACGSDPVSPEKPVSSDLLPLQVGYTWVYGAPSKPFAPDAPRDRVVSAQVLGDHTYFRVEGDVLGLVLRDEAGPLWVRSTETAILVRAAGNPTEGVFADLALPPGTHFEYRGSPARRDPNRETLTVPFGSFTDVPRFSYELDVADGGFGLALAPGVGVVQAAFGSIAGSRVYPLHEAPTRVP